MEGNRTLVQTFEEDFTLGYKRFNVGKGALTGPFWTNFRKTSKRPLTPPPSFRKTMLRFLAPNFSDWSNPAPPFPENSWLFSLKITAKICNIIFWNGNDAPPLSPFGSFPKIHPNLIIQASLSHLSLLSDESMPSLLFKTTKKPLILLDAYL